MLRCEGPPSPLTRFPLAAIATFAALATLLSASTAAAEDAITEAPRPEAAERASTIAYVTMTAGVAALATGGVLYAVGSVSIPEGCTVQSCDVRRANGWPSADTTPCARNIRQDGCVGSAYNVNRLGDAGRAQAMTSAGVVTAALGAVALAGGFVLWLRTPSAGGPASSRSPIASAHVAPVLGMSAGGMTLVATF